MASNESKNKHMEENQEEIVWEMDTVECVKVGKLERILGHEQTIEIFQVILTDNGTEFSNPELFAI